MSTTRATWTTLLLAALCLRPALAQGPDEQPRSNFAEAGIEIDGDYVDDAALEELDWFPDFEPFQDPIRQADDSLCGTSPSPKNDVTNTYIANNFEHLYIGMERLANRGNTSFFFTFDITGDGPSSGDFVFVFCFGSGDRVTDTYVLEWDGVLGQFVRDQTPPSVVFSVNTERVLAPFGALDRHGRPTPTIEPGKFAEARILLADIEGFDVCAASDVTVEVQTKSSCSLNSQCKDTSGEFHFSFAPLTVSLEVAQPDACAPEIVATANADSPRSDPLAYRWFLNGEDITDQDPSWASSDSITIPLADECGENVVSVIADDGACEAAADSTVNVNRQPTAAIARASVDACGQTLTYSAASSTDCNGDPLTFEWDFDGDGVVDSRTESGTHVYEGCGERLVSLVVSDGACPSEPDSRTVYVNEPPTAGLVLSSAAAHCLEVAFEVTSVDCDELQVSDSYSESISSVTDFGDGSPPAADGSGVHRYADCGTYEVTTTTTDASGCVDSVTRTVTVDVVAEVD